MQVLLSEGGAVFGKSKIGGMWIKQDQELHIKVLKLSGAELEFLSFLRNNADIKQFS